MRKNVNEGSVELWCPVSGECYFFEYKSNPSSFLNFGAKPYMTYRVQDPVCPMKRVFFIVASDNIYANIQKSDFPVLMNFNITDAKSWKPLFKDAAERAVYFRTADDIKTYQETPLAYTPPMPIENCTILA